jgi:acylphosphatase
MRRRYLIEGQVQGVGFRYFAIRSAQRIGIKGWVRNLPDGRVETVGDGTPDQLARYESELRRGPPLASVTILQVMEILDESEPLSSFQIR